MRATEKQSDSANGGKRPGAGRKKGVPNKRTAELQAQVEAQGITPLEFMLQVMRTEPDPSIEEPRELMAIMMLRFEAAKSAAPYIHAKLTSIDLSGSVKLGVTIMATPLDERL